MIESPVRATWILALLGVVGCRPVPEPPSPASVPASPVPDAEPESVGLAAVHTLRDYPVAAEILARVVSPRRTPNGEETKPVQLEAFVGEFTTIAAQDVAMAIAWAQLVREGPAWKETFGQDSEAASAGVTEAITQAGKALPRPIESTDLRMISSPLSPSGLDRAKFNAVGALVDGRMVTVAANPVGELAGFTLSEDRRRALVIYEVDSGYGGAIVPGFFKSLTMTSVSLDDLTSSTVAMDCQERIDSAAFVGFDGARVRIRLRASWGDEGHAWLDCDLDRGECAAMKPDHLLATPPYFEVTAQTAYEVEPPPSGFHSPAGLLPRSVRVSPDGSRSTFVTQKLVKLRPDPDWSRTLWIANANGSDARQVAEGWGWFHARWTSDGTLIYEADPRPSDSMSERLATYKAELAAAGEPGESDWAPTQFQQQRLDLMLLAFELGDDPHWQALDYSLVRYDPQTGERALVRSNYPMRLWSSFTQPKIVGSRPSYVEVPSEVDKPKSFDPKCEVKRINGWPA